jgi:hypothetical protein
MENTNNEIREIGGKKYEVTKLPCDCPCHLSNLVNHCTPCCNNGWVEQLREVK